MEKVKRKRATEKKIKEVRKKKKKRFEKDFKIWRGKSAGKIEDFKRKKKYEKHEKYLNIE